MQMHGDRPTCARWWTMNFTRVEYKLKMAGGWEIPTDLLVYIRFPLKSNNKSGWYFIYNLML